MPTLTSVHHHDNPVVLETQQQKTSVSPGCGVGFSISASALCLSEHTSEFEHGVFLFGALQDKLTVDEFPDALNGESYLEDRDRGYTIKYLLNVYYCSSLYSTAFHKSLLKS